MQQSKLESYHNIVENKYQIYNSLFANLPYQQMSEIGMLIPFLYSASVVGFKKGKTPKQIIDYFFNKHTDITDENDKIDLLFRFVQYIERQVVLFDSIEEASFPTLHTDMDEGTLHNLFQLAKQQNQLEEIKNKLNNYNIRIVFTAHPTQFYTNAVQRIIQDLRIAVQKDSISQIDLLLKQLGKTPFIKNEKPTPFDEANSIIYYLRYFYYDAIGELYDNLKMTFFKADEELNPQIFQLGFWPGGDRDGNPFVTADITLKVANQLRISILKSYYNHLKNLRKRLTFKGVDDLVTQLSNRLYKNMFSETSDLSLDEMEDYILKIRNLIINEHDSLFLDKINVFYNRFKIFGFHFATLDIRQDSSIHKKVINSIIQKVHQLDFEALSDIEKVQILTEEEHNLNWQDFDETIVQETIKNVQQLRTIQKLNGELGVHRYIISNSETIFDVLSVYALFKYCGYKNEEIKFDIIPLFETIKGLENAEDTMRTLYNLPIYSQHLKHRKNAQTIMLGFSDGTKDGGYLKANWEIYRTKETLSRVSVENDILVKFFDGRGGPPARGGGKTHKFYASQGNTISNNAIELTIQGQTITSMYGSKPQAKYNLEQLLTAGMFSSVLNVEKNKLSDENRDLLNRLADLSYAKYSDLKAHEKFVPYLEKMSTLKYYGKTNIGSRPSKRGNSKELNFSQLRAIPFVGSWSLLKQNVPGYFGVGSALETLEQEGKIDDLKRLFNESEFFKALILNSMMALQKTNFELTAYMKENQEFSEFWEILNDEFERSKAMTLKISELDILMQDEPSDKESIRMRDHIILPLLTVQQYALEILQEGTKNTEIYEKLVTRSLFGNINASRNSA